MDAQGRERVAAISETKALTYPVLVDAQNVLGGAYGFLALPNAFVVDEQGVLRYQRLSTFNIATPEIRAELEGVLAGGPPVSASDPVSPVGEAAVLFSQGAVALAAGRRDEALALWRRSRALDPGNFVTRKQIWAVEHPEKFYPEIDLAWQKELLARGE